MKSRILSAFLMFALLVGVAPASYARIVRSASSTSSPSSVSSSSSRRVVTTTQKPVYSKPKPPTVVVKKNPPVVVKSPRIPVVSRAPKRSTVIYHNGRNYYHNDSKYYVKSGPKYIVTPPPVGLRVSVLPAIHKVFIFNNIRYYNSNGIIYAPVTGSTGQYEVAKPQVGMIVPELPQYNVNQVMINNNTYFEFDGYLYQQIPTANGLMYEVVGNLSL